MSDATYILGTVDYVICEVMVSSPGFAYVPADWNAEMVLIKSSEAFDAATAPWTAATLETADGKHYAKALLADAGATTIGTYRVYVRQTKKASGIVVPIVRASGAVTLR